jgi:hypothetical protein
VNATLHIMPWTDPIVERVGHRPDSPYVEQFWLPTIGPTGCWLYRRLGRVVASMTADSAPMPLDVEILARSVGINTDTLAKSLTRLGQFRFIRSAVGAETIEVRRRVPDLSLQQLRRLPEPLQVRHANEFTRSINVGVAV